METHGYSQITVDKMPTKKEGVEMTNSELLREKIAESGMKKSAIAERIGVSKQCFYNKMNGQEWTAKQIDCLREILRLSDADVIAIFFG